MSTLLPVILILGEFLCKGYEQLNVNTINELLIFLTRGCSRRMYVYYFGNAAY